jgi:hypothetical protein
MPYSSRGLRGKATGGAHMQAMSITYKGFVLMPVAANESDGSVSMLIITGPDGLQRASGVLGCFANDDEACRFALEHGIEQVDQIAVPERTDGETSEFEV